MKHLTGTGQQIARMRKLQPWEPGIVVKVGVTAKRNLSAKYGAITRRKPGARWRRAKKRIKRAFS